MNPAVPLTGVDQTKGAALQRFALVISEVKVSLERFLQSDV